MVCRSANVVGGSPFYLEVERGDARWGYRPKSPFGAIALLLSAIGLYGLLSSSVTQTTGEIGVRVALGAPCPTVRWMILKEAFILLAAGIVLGGFLLYTTVRFIQGMLYRIAAFDPVTLLTVIALLAAVAFVAAFVPALRASRVDPMVALRYE